MMAGRAKELFILPDAPDLTLEQEAWDAGFVRIAGVDEAGRGCLAGPVVAAAVILDPHRPIEGLNDSKKLSFDAREALAPIIRERALATGIGVCTPAEIDRWNILQASMEAMRRAVAELDPVSDFLLVDGNRAWNGAHAPVRTAVKGDARSLSIAAASILAKTHRDAVMTELARHHPGYGWEQNRGYPTPEHFDALAQLGPTEHHRRSFRLRIPEDDVPDLFSGSCRAF